MSSAYGKERQKEAGRQGVPECSRVRDEGLRVLVNFCVRELATIMKG